MIRQAGNESSLAVLALTRGDGMNLTLDIDDEIAAKVSKIAAAQDTTVAAMVSEYLTAMANDTGVLSALVLNQFC